MVFLYMIIINLFFRYGKAMLDLLPEKDFKWIEGDAFDHIQKDPEAFLSTLKDDDKTGYFFEVTLSVPEDKHDLLNDFPPCPVKREVCENEISVHQDNQKAELNISDTCFKTKKLVADLKTKKKLCSTLSKSTDICKTRDENRNRSPSRIIFSKSLDGTIYQFQYR